MTSYYDQEELQGLNFKSVGENVLISKKTSIYGHSRISIGDNVRIDDFCVLSAGKGGIEVGNYVHIAIFASLQGEGAIKIKDFASISSRVSIYSSNDDFSGEHMIGPTVPNLFRGVVDADVILGKFVAIGSGAIVLPGVTIGDGAVVGALSYINKNCQGFYIYDGKPARKIIKRSQNLLKLEEAFMESLKRKDLK